MSEDVYFEDLLHEMERLDSANPEGFTSWEMSKALDRSQAWCRKKIRLLVDAGKIQFNGHKRVQRSDLKMGLTPVYKIIGGG
jgi:hypothetical protein